MLTLLCFLLAVLAWGAGAIKLSYTTGSTPPKTHAPDWFLTGLFFAGLGLWFAPLL